MLSRRECARLMGFPDDWIPSTVSRTQAYRQFGNSVAVPVVRFIGAALVQQGILPVSRGHSRGSISPCRLDACRVLGAAAVRGN